MEYKCWQHCPRTRAVTSRLSPSPRERVALQGAAGGCDKNSAPRKEGKWRGRTKHPLESSHTLSKAWLQRQQSWEEKWKQEAKSNREIQTGHGGVRRAWRGRTGWRWRLEGQEKKIIINGGDDVHLLPKVPAPTISFQKKKTKSSRRSGSGWDSRLQNHILELRSSASVYM